MMFTITHTQPQNMLNALEKIAAVSTMVIMITWSITARYIGLFLPNNAFLKIFDGDIPRCLQCNIF